MRSYIYNINTYQIYIKPFWKEPRARCNVEFSIHRVSSRNSSSSFPNHQLVPLTRPSTHRYHSVRALVNWLNIIQTSGCAILLCLLYAGAGPPN